MTLRNRNLTSNPKGLLLLAVVKSITAFCSADFWMSFQLFRLRPGGLLNLRSAQRRGSSRCTPNYNDLVDAVPTHGFGHLPKRIQIDALLKQAPPAATEADSRNSRHELNGVVTPFRVRDCFIPHALDALV